MNSFNKDISILLIDDDEDDYILVRDLFEEITSFKADLCWIKNYQEAKASILQMQHELYLIDYRLGELDGLTLLTEAIDKGVQQPLILLTGKGDRAIDMKAMEAGAYDYLIKSELTPELLERTIRYALNHAHTISLLRKEEDKFRQLFEKSGEAIFIADLDFVLMDVNEAFCKMLKLTKQNMLGKRLSEFLMDQSAISSMIEGNDLNNNKEIRFQNIDGEEMYCLFNASERVDQNNQVIGYQGIMHDVSFKKKAEHELIIAERMSLTGKLARSIAHEVRNPLTNLGLAVDQLEDEIPIDLDVDFFIRIIRRNTNRIDQLISDLLNSSRTKELNITEYPISQLLDETIEMVSDRLALRNISLIRDYNGSNLTAFIDVEMIKMALLNILVNAIEAIEGENGELNVGLSVNSNSALITIQDNGKGLTPEEMNQLFDPFYTNKEQGMGLGLTTTQHIIHAHQGKVMVTSDPGQGTCFKIFIPTSS